MTTALIWPICEESPQLLKRGKKTKAFERCWERIQSLLERPETRPHYSVCPAPPFSLHAYIILLLNLPCPFILPWLTFFLAHDFVLRSLPAQSVRGCARNLLPSGPKRLNTLLDVWLCAYFWFFSCYFGKPCQKYICGGYNAIIDNALISISASPSVTPCHGHTQYRMPYYAYIPNIWSPYLVTEFYIMQIFLISGYHWKSVDL